MSFGDNSEDTQRTLEKKRALSNGLAQCLQQNLDPVLGAIDTLFQFQ